MIEPKESVKKMEPYDPPLEGRRGLVRLDFNENTIGPSPKVLEALRNLSNEDIAAYPEYNRFKEKLANYLKIKKSQLAITNATDQAIKLIMDVYIDKNDEIILPIPTFAMFKFYASIVGANIKEVLYNEDLSFPAEKVLETINKKTRMVILVNPNNPTGSSIKREDIITIIEKAKNSIILLDEAYVQYTNETCIDLIDKYDNLMIIQTFSKAFGLAGLRLGYIISNEVNIKNISKAASKYDVNSAAVIAASAALDDTNYVQRYAKEVKESKKLVYDELKELNIKAYPSSANFLLAYFGKKSKEIQSKLREKGVLVRDRSKYPLLKGCIRIGIGTREQTRFFIKCLKETLRNQRFLVPSKKSFWRH